RRPHRPRRAHQPAQPAGHRLSHAPSGDGLRMPAVPAADPTLRHAGSAAEVAACFPVMRALRPHLADAAALTERVARQAAEGYRLLAAWQGPRPLALAGYRVQEMLLHGRVV